MEKESKESLQIVEKETKELRKDLNMRKEIEEIKRQIMEIKMRLYQNKKAGLDPIWFIIVIGAIIIIMFYLRDKGLI